MANITTKILVCFHMDKNKRVFSKFNDFSSKDKCGSNFLASSKTPTVILLFTLHHLHYIAGYDFQSSLSPFLIPEKALMMVKKLKYLLTDEV